MRRERFGDLDVAVAGGPDREGGGDGPLVVLCHGFGAPGEDLVPLWRVMDVPSEVRFAFPAAPLALPEYGGGRAWWMIDMERMQRAMLDVQLRGAEAAVEHLERLADEEPPGLADARAALEATLDALASKLRPSKLILGGFSQGAMLATDLTLRTARSVDALVILSGTLLARRAWEAAAPSRAGLPVLQSHGLADPILPFVAAERLRDLLSAAGLAVEFVPFRDGHAIPDGVVERLAALIRDRG